MPSAPHSQTVPDDQHGIRLADFLERWFPDLDRVQLRRLALDGGVQVNRMPAKAQHRLLAGDLVELGTGLDDLRARPAPKLEPAVLLETASALVIDKPAGLPVVPDRFRKGPSVHALLPQLGEGQDLRVVHRLDRDTSGCLLLAKGLQAARHFDAAFRGGAMHKQYLALCAGTGELPAVIDLLLGPDPARHGKVVTSTVAKKGFRTARTELQVEARFQLHTLLRLWPRTGRGHQLRAHLAAIGHPIVGDADYGGEELLLSALKRRYKQRSGQRERPLLTRMFLHAAELAFPDLDGSARQAAAPLAEDLRSVLAKLERFAAGHR